MLSLIFDGEAALSKIDFRKSLPDLYGARAGDFAPVAPPPMQFVMIDGAGDPNTAPAYSQAIEWLYSVSYALKFAVRAAQGMDYVVPPLEGLFWSDDPTDFTARRKARWRWTMMIMAPDFVARADFDAAVEKARKKLGAPPASLRFERYDEGPSLQILHVGPYDDEGPTLARLHDEIMPAKGLTFAGRHHEIYLSDPRKTAPAKLKTILRQPVRPR